MKNAGVPQTFTAGLDTALLLATLPHVDPGRARIKVAPRALPFIGRFLLPGARAMTMPWGVYLHPKATAGGTPAPSLVAHELAHLEQWRRLGVFGFLHSYLGDYLRARWSGRSHVEAYQAIGLEQEALEVARTVAARSNP